MKLRRLAEDFQVEEQISLAAGNGPFALYKLTKQSLGTLEAIEAISRRWHLPRQHIAFAGLKDKHALTMQFVTIDRGPQRSIAESSFELKYVGQCERPVHASDIVANRFAIVARDLAAADLEQATTAIAAVERDGLPNYFDQQRFGSLGQSGEFIARPWCLGDYERAMWLAIADDNARDRPDVRGEKGTIREHWGNWHKCLELLPASVNRGVFAHLANQHGDFRRAIGLLRQDLRSLWLAAFQSHLWNQVLAAFIDQTCERQKLVFHRIGKGDLPFYSELDDSQRQRLNSTVLPLPSARLHLDDSPLQAMYQQVLAAEGIELRQVRVKYPRDSFFSKGERSAVVRPGQFAHQSAADEHYPARHKLSLTFTLPRGAYATILIKRLMGRVDDEADEAA